MIYQSIFNQLLSLGILDCEQKGITRQQSRVDQYYDLQFQLLYYYHSLTFIELIERNDEVLIKPLKIEIVLDSDMGIAALYRLVEDGDSDNTCHVDDQVLVHQLHNNSMLDHNLQHYVEIGHFFKS